MKNDVRYQRAIERNINNLSRRVARSPYCSRENRKLLWRLKSVLGIRKDDNRYDYHLNQLLVKD